MTDNAILSLWNSNNVNSVLLLNDDNNFLQKHLVHSHFAHDSPLAGDTLWKQEATWDFVDLSHIFSLVYGEISVYAELWMNIVIIWMAHGCKSRHN